MCFQLGNLGSTGAVQVQVAKGCSTCRSFFPNEVTQRVSFARQLPLDERHLGLAHSYLQLRPHQQHHHLRRRAYNIMACSKSPAAEEDEQSPAVVDVQGGDDVHEGEVGVEESSSDEHKAEVCASSSATHTVPRLPTRSRSILKP